MLIRISSYCNGGCINCPFVSSSSKEKQILPYKVFEQFIELLGNLEFNEAVFLCPNPLTAPHIEKFIEKVGEIARRTYMVIPLRSVQVLRRGIAEELDEIFLLATDKTEASLAEKYLKSLVSQGLENISVYLGVRRIENLLDNVASFRTILERYNIRLRIGELPYIDLNTLKITNYLRKKGYEVGLPHGYMLGYTASVCFIDGYAVTVLEKPITLECRKIYIDFYGRISKCPYLVGRMSRYLDDIDIRSIRRIMYSRCPIKGNLIDLIPVIDIGFLTGDNNVLIPKDIIVLLEILANMRSFRQACELLGYNPSTYISKIRTLEKELGYKLIDSYKGGNRRGYTELTPQAMKIIKRYRELREHISKKLFDEGYVNFMI